MKYAKGDYITDSNGHSVEIIEATSDRYYGRKLGFLWPEAAWECAAHVVDEMALTCRTYAERLATWEARNAGRADQDKTPRP